MFNFEKLDAWAQAIAFADQVYTTTAKFPVHERYGLSDQMRRAAVSVSSNIAEGSSRSSRNDFARYVEIATGSLFEVVSQAAVGRRQQLVSEADFQAIYSAAERLGKICSGLRTSLLRSSKRIS